MTWTAPTPRELVDLRADLTVFCPACRSLRAPIKLAEQLAGGRWAATPIDRLLFRCEICGGRGEPRSNLPGNALLGRAQIWPPAEAEGR